MKYWIVFSYRDSEGLHIETRIESLDVLSKFDPNEYENNLWQTAGNNESEFRLINWRILDE